MKPTIDVETEEIAGANMLPIREISRLTGVNTVTLRAWERRYGLLIPRRTTKGHRLYSGTDVDRVKEIQLWLGRGLAISKVKALLADEQRNDLMPEINSIWLQLAYQIQGAITAFNRNQLERLIGDVFTLYPIPMIADYLLMPLLVELEGDEPGKQMRRAFFSAVLSEYLQYSQNRQRQAARGEKVLLLSATPNDSAILPQTFNYGLLVNQYQTEFLGYLGAKESALCAEALGAKIVVIMGSEMMSPGELKSHLKLWQEHPSTNLFLVGDVVRVFRALNLRPWAGIHLCDTQRQALAAIDQLLKR